MHISVKVRPLFSYCKHYDQSHYWKAGYLTLAWIDVLQNPFLSVVIFREVNRERAVGKWLGNVITWVAHSRHNMPNDSHWTIYKWFSLVSMRFSWWRVSNCNHYIPEQIKTRCPNLKLIHSQICAKHRPKLKQLSGKNHEAIPWQMISFKLQ